jgi:hypothetical protein
MSLVACTSEEHHSGNDASVLTPSASASTSIVPAPPVPTFEARLSALAAPDGKSADVHLAVPSLGVDETVGTVHGSDMCTMWTAGAAATVSCTPDYRTSLVKLSSLGTDLVLDRPVAKPRSIPLPPGGRLVAPQTSVGARDGSGAGCASDAGAFDVRFASQAELVDNPHIDVQMIVGNESVPLFELVGPVSCTLTPDADHFAIDCESRRMCTVRTPVGRIELSCQVPKRADLSLLLPCGATARLATGQLPRTVHYH